MRKWISGIVIGVVLTVGTSALAEQIKQYILTPAAYPIVVNGVEYKDETAPILNYEGSTYVPLAKLGDLTGVNYKWNDELKRVEIVTGMGGNVPPDANHNLMTGTKMTPGGDITLTPDMQIVDPKGLVQEHGETVLYAYDKDGIYRGKFSDDDNVAVIFAKVKGDPLPPKIADGWLDAGALERIYGQIEYDGDDYVVRSADGSAKKQEFYRFPLPTGWHDLTEGDTVSNGVRVKKFDHGNYFNIDDLFKTGILTK